MPCTRPLARGVGAGVSWPPWSALAPSARWPLPIRGALEGGLAQPGAIRPVPGASTEEVGGTWALRSHGGGRASAHLGPKRSRDGRDGARRTRRGRPPSRQGRRHRQSRSPSQRVGLCVALYAAQVLTQVSKKIPGPLSGPGIANVWSRGLDLDQRPPGHERVRGRFTANLVNPQHSRYASDLWFF